MVKRWWWLFIAGAVIAGGAAFLVTQTITPTYRASATLLVDLTQQPGTIVYNDILASERLTKTYSELITQRPVLEGVLAAGEFSDLTVGELSGKLDVSITRDTQLLRVSISDAVPAQAALLANAVAATFVIQQNELSVARAGTVSVVESAERPISPVSPNLRLNILLAIVVGLILAGGLALLLEYLDDTVKSPEDVKALADLPILGEVGRWDTNREEIHMVKRGERATEREAYGMLRTNVRFSTLGKSMQVVLVTSANANEGKTTTAANLAATFAEAGKKVALVDADLRRPSLHKAFGLENRVGLTTALLKDELVLGDVFRPAPYATLRLMTSGPLPPNPAELLDWEGFDALLERLKEEVDLVVLDSPPVLAVADARILSARADATILVIDSGKTRAGAVRKTLQALENAKATILGVVLNKVRKNANSYEHYYYSSDPEDSDSSKKPPTSRLKKSYVGSANGDVKESAEAA
jgi:capsular exopolysaccharide synthesis family protein